MPCSPWIAASHAMSHPEFPAPTTSTFFPASSAPERYSDGVVRLRRRTCPDTRGAADPSCAPPPRSRRRTGRTSPCGELHVPTVCRPVRLRYRCLESNVLAEIELVGERANVVEHLLPRRIIGIVRRHREVVERRLRARGDEVRALVDRRVRIRRIPDAADIAVALEDIEGEPRTCECPRSREPGRARADDAVARTRLRCATRRSLSRRSSERRPPCTASTFEPSIPGLPITIPGTASPAAFGCSFSRRSTSRRGHVSLDHVVAHERRVTRPHATWHTVMILQRVHVGAIVRVHGEAARLHVLHPLLAAAARGVLVDRHRRSRECGAQRHRRRSRASRSVLLRRRVMRREIHDDPS